MNVKNAAIHYHFHLKKDLGVAVIQRAQARFREWDAFAEKGGLSLVEMLNESLDTYLDYLKSGEYVCLAGSLETDFHTFSEEMQNEIRIYVTEILTWMRNFLSRGREKGLFSFSGPSENMAFYIIASVQGALQMARVSDKNLFHSTVDKFKSELGI